MRAFRVRLPAGISYWTVLDDDLCVVPEADRYLRQVRFGADGAELTCKAYAGAIALYLAWCQRTGRDWRIAGTSMGMFMTWLKYVPRNAGMSGGAEVVLGPHAEPVRGPSRVNVVLAGVRGFLVHGIAAGSVPADVASALYELGSDRDLPDGARAEDGVVLPRLKARHRMTVPKRVVDRATDEEIVALLRACRSARDRLVVLLLARVGLRRSEVVGLRREDMHFSTDSSAMGCLIGGAHLHVKRRDNINGAWAKSVHNKPVPVDVLVVRAHDQYVFEREKITGEVGSDFVVVNLFREPIGSPMTPGAVNELFGRLEARAGLARHVSPHMCRHAYASNLVDAGATWDEVQELLRHVSPTSTAIYMHPSVGRLRDAVERVPSPRETSGADR